MMNQSHVSDLEILAVVDGEIARVDQGYVIGHLAHCAPCRERRAQLIDTLQQAVAGRSGLFTPGDDDTQRLRARLEAAMATAAGPAVNATRGPARVWPAALGVTASLVFGALWLSDHSPFQTGDRGDWHEVLPIASLTPGATSDVGLGELCDRQRPDPGPVPDDVRQRVLRNYRMEHVPANEYELDYLITPELGGAPDPRNLWPQRYLTAAWNASAKDQLEDLLPRLVCERQVALATAQHDIAANWIAAYKKYFKVESPLHPASASLRPLTSSLDDERAGLAYRFPRYADSLDHLVVGAQ